LRGDLHAGGENASSRAVEEALRRHPPESNDIRLKGRPTSMALFGGLPCAPEELVVVLRARAAGAFRNFIEPGADIFRARRDDAEFREGAVPRLDEEREVGVLPACRMDRLFELLVPRDGTMPVGV
jgi:hypothetical protein